MNKYLKNTPFGCSEVIRKGTEELSPGKEIGYEIIKDEHRKNFLKIIINGKAKYSYLPEEIMKDPDLYLESEIFSLVGIDGIQPPAGGDATR